MPGLVVVGLQFGDEGKGKVVDYYAENADMVVRYAGGPNAGHTLIANGRKTVLRLIPSGVLHEKVSCVLGNGMVIDPFVLQGEFRALDDAGVDWKNRIVLSSQAHVIMPYHIQVDAYRESKASVKIGTTKKGIGPCYEDKVSRRGIRVVDLVDVKEPELIKNRQRWMRAEDIEESEKEMWQAEDELCNYLKKAREILIPYIIDTPVLVNLALNAGKNVLFEGAQGTELDIDHGTYPFVTSSSAISGGACTGSGVGPTKINKVIGITKAYTTRVGEGPFPTELNNEIGEHLRRVGNEYGSVTGRPRRVGWLNLQDLKYACMVNGTTGLAITKLDILSGLSSISVCTSYEDTVNLKTFEGWTEDLSSAKKFSDLPKNAQKYIEYIESCVEVPVCLISVGADRDNTILTRDAFI